MSSYYSWYVNGYVRQGRNVYGYITSNYISIILKGRISTLVLLGISQPLTNQESGRHLLPGRKINLELPTARFLAPSTEAAVAGHAFLSEQIMK